MKKNAGREGTLVFVTIFIAVSGESVLHKTRLKIWARWKEGGHHELFKSKL